MRTCPKCGEEMEFEPPEPDVGIIGGWHCNACDYVKPADMDDFDRED